jgi:hypothetical protein
MSTIDIIALIVASVVVASAIGVAIYKWKNNTRADFSERK